MRLFLLFLGLCVACGLRTPEQRERDWAESMTPKPLVSASPVAPPPVLHTVHVRAFVDHTYVSQNPQWESRVRAIVERASGVTEARYGARFELLGVGAWDHPELQSLDALLQNLHAEQPEGDADLVIGFTSSLQLFTSTFEDLGRASYFGHHAVLRGIDQHAQSDVIMNDLKRLSVEEKLAVVRARAEHQEAIVFLHEWGHTAGALHDRDTAFIMSPVYKTSSREFSPASEKSLDLALKHLHSDRSAWLAEARVLLQSLPRSALAPDAERLIAELSGGAGDGGTLEPKAEARPVSEADRQLFNIAVEKQREGRAPDALATLSALVKRYPANPMVQTFACSLSLQVKAPNALEQCNTALSVAPDDPRPALNLAWAQADAEQVTAARQAALEARRRASAGKRDPRLQAELGQTLVRVGYLSFGEEEARRAELTVSAQEVLDAAARTRRSIGLPEGAVPPEDEAGFIAGWQEVSAAMRSRKPPGARERAAALVKAYPKVAGAWSIACEAQLAQGFSADARSSCGRALQLDAAAARPHYLLAVMDENERKRGSAIEHLEKAIASDASNEDAWRRLSALYAATRMDSARAALQQRYQARFGRPLK